jgi:hypothetical protein
MGNDMEMSELLSFATFSIVSNNLIQKYNIFWFLTKNNWNYSVSGRKYLHIKKRKMFEMKEHCS